MEREQVNTSRPGIAEGPDLARDGQDKFSGCSRGRRTTGDRGICGSYGTYSHSRARLSLWSCRQNQSQLSQRPLLSGDGGIPSCGVPERHRLKSLCTSIMTEYRQLRSKSRVVPSPIEQPGDRRNVTITASYIPCLTRTNVSRRVQSLASWQLSQEIKCGAARLTNSRGVMILVFFQNLGKCLLLPVIR
jgi:hypothetical protein